MIIMTSLKRSDRIYAYPSWKKVYKANNIVHAIEELKSIRGVICIRMRIWAHALFSMHTFKIRMLVLHQGLLYLHSHALLSMRISHANAHAFTNKPVTYAHASGSFLGRIQHVTRMLIFACALWNSRMLYGRKSWHTRIFSSLKLEIVLAILYCKRIFQFQITKNIFIFYKMHILQVELIN